MGFIWGYNKADIESLEEQLDAALEAEQKLRREFSIQKKELEGAKEEYATLQSNNDRATELLETRNEEIALAQRENKGLETRLTQVPNREIITVKAIHELAQGLSDTGYDAFLQEMIVTMVDRGITAYTERRPEEKGFKQIVDQEFEMYIGKTLLDDLEKPKVDLMMGDFTLQPMHPEEYDSAGDRRGGLREKYGGEPSIKLTFRNEASFWQQSAYRTHQLLETVLPKEWETKLEADKDKLLQGFAFGYLASHYEDVAQNPARATQRSGGGEWKKGPHVMLEMQERAGLIDNQSILQGLYDAVNGDEKFSASVLPYFSSS